MQSPKRLFLTGQSGFVGGAFRRLLETEPYRSRSVLVSSTHPLTLHDKDRLQADFAAARPDWVIHLAAQSFVPRSLTHPRETFEVNLLGTLNVLEALRAIGYCGRFLFIGSGDTYGLVNENDLPVSETHPLDPRSPYAVSKAAAEMLCRQWCRTEGMDIVLARPFNHIGRGQDERFALSGFARQIVEIRHGRREPVIATGDLAVTRDFTDVQDVVDAYLALLDRGARAEVYNVCSGREYRLRELLDRLLGLAGVKARIVPDPARLRPAEQKRMVGSCCKLMDATGWRPRIDIEQSLKDVLNYWEEMLVDH